jgi:uncharacterized protein YqeY
MSHDRRTGTLGKLGSVSALEDRLRASLKEAVKSRDAVARSAIRSALGAIDNAGSVGVNNNPDLSSRSSGRIAGSVQGLGAGDAARRELDEGQIIEIVRAEVTNRNMAATEYEELGRIDEADRLRSECDVLLRLLPNDIAG